MGIKETFCRELHMELQLFKETLLKENRDVIFGSSYKIEVFVNLYEILMELSDEIEEETMANMIQEDSGILEKLYQGWLKREDSFYEELKEYAGNVLADKEAWNGVKMRKEQSGYGKKCDTAA